MPTSPSRLRIAFALLTLAACALPAAASVPLSAIAYDGQPTGDAGGSINFFWPFQSAAIADNGTVGFKIDVQRDGNDLGPSILAWNGSSLITIVGPDHPALPGDTPPTTIWNAPFVTRDGTLWWKMSSRFSQVFSATPRPDGTYNLSGIIPTLDDGQLAPYAFEAPIAFSRSGSIFYIAVTPAMPDHLNYVQDGIHKTMPVVGRAPDGSTIPASGIRTFSPGGRTLFASFVSGTITGLTLYDSEINPAHRVFNPGDLAPGTAARFQALAPDGWFTYDQSINDAGQVIFSALLTGDGVTPDNDRGLWTTSVANGPLLLAREGDPAPGTNLTFKTLVDWPVLRPALAADGTVTFGATLTDPTNLTANQGLWTGRPDNVRKIAAMGDPTPGIPGGIFSEINSFAVAPSGLIAFTAYFDLPDGSSGSGLWTAASPDALSLILQTGDAIHIGADLDTVARLTIAFPNNDTDSVVNANDQLLLYVTLPDWRNALTIVSLPEPTTILPLSALLTFQRRRRTR